MRRASKAKQSLTQRIQIRTPFRLKCLRTKSSPAPATLRGQQGGISMPKKPPKALKVAKLQGKDIRDSGFRSKTVSALVINICNLLLLAYSLRLSCNTGDKYFDSSFFRTKSGSISTFLGLFWPKSMVLSPRVRIKACVA